MHGRKNARPWPNTHSPPCRCSSLYQGCDAATRRNFTLSHTSHSSQVRDHGVRSCQGLRWRFQWLYPHINNPTADFTTQGIILKGPWLITAHPITQLCAKSLKRHVGDRGMRKNNSDGRKNNSDRRKNNNDRRTNNSDRRKKKERRHES